VKRRFTFWQTIGILMMLFGLWATFIRITKGLGAMTNLSNAVPWGIWIGFDVLVGVGLAAGGFTITAVVHIFGLERFKPIVRPTILTAFLGYLLVIVGLLFDLGRPFRIWHPIIMWNPHSVMFEVAWCVTLYTTVLMLEFSPIVLEKFNLQKPLKIVRAITVPTVILGVLLSTLHQSSLGTLYIIMPDKLYGLWYTPFLPVLFFVSAIAGGLSMVIVESGLSARVFGRHLENDLLTDMSRVIVAVLTLYLVIKLQDMASRNALPLLLIATPESFLFWVEVGFGAILPLILLAIPPIRQDPSARFYAALLVVLGFVLNRLNIATTGMQRGLQANYFPSPYELAITGMLLVLGFVAFSLAVKYLPIFPQQESHLSPALSHPTPHWVSVATRGALMGLAAVLLGGVFFIDFGVPIMASETKPMPRIVANDTPIRLPQAITLPRSPDSPGPVTFRHTTHVDQNTPACGNCHANTYSLFIRTTQSLGETMHSPHYCGQCHNGEKAFNWEDNCESCHVEP
jgi:c(7)-type cytochrome triheme protein